MEKHLAALEVAEAVQQVGDDAVTCPNDRISADSSRERLERVVALGFHTQQLLHLQS